MRYCGLRAIALVLVALPLLASTAFADIVDLHGEIRLPKKAEIISPWDVYPSSDELRASGTGNLKLAYDVFEYGPTTKGPAAQITGVYVTTAILNVNYASGETNAARGFWSDAAAAYAEAAHELNGAAKQVALYKCMMATANMDDEAALLRIADELLAAFPKGYYFGSAHEMRARIFARNGRMKDAQAALQLIIDAPGMNVRDKFSAAYLQVWLKHFVSADSKEKYEAAEKGFRDLLTQLDRARQNELAHVPRLKILNDLASCVRALGRTDEAKELFDQVLRAAGKTTDKSVLAGVYYGMGDMTFEEASKLQENAAGNEALKQTVMKLLDQAALHYLRVILLYKDYAGTRELFGATQGIARVFTTIFKLSGEKDCEKARKAYQYFRQAVQLQPAGEAKRLLVREGMALKKRIDEACKRAGEEEDD